MINIYRNGNIICTCMWHSLHPENYIKGLKCCKHITKYIKNTKQDLDAPKEVKDG